MQRVLNQSSRPFLCDPMSPWAARLLCRWDFPGKSTGVGCHSLLQGVLFNPFYIIVVWICSPQTSPSPFFSSGNHAETRTFEKEKQAVLKRTAVAVLDQRAAFLGDHFLSGQWWTGGEAAAPAGSPVQIEGGLVNRKAPQCPMQLFRGRGIAVLVLCILCKYRPALSRAAVCSQHRPPNTHTCARARSALHPAGLSAQ